MVQNNEEDHYLPSREISYTYTVAMYFSQQLEIHLKAILYTADYHGWGDDIELDVDELKRFKNTDTLIDRATCGLIIKKLKSIGLIKDNRAWKAFERACEHRNKLAHTFLSSQNFDGMTKQKEATIIRLIHKMTSDLYQALVISRAVRTRAELSADEAHESLRSFMRDCGIDDYENLNRHYDTRKRKKNG